MEDVSFRKRQLEESLRVSEERLDGLKESLEKSDQLTSNMMAILDSFTLRLKKLDETIIPVYEKTKKLMQLQENVDKTLGQLDKVIGYHHVADDVETKVQNGPSGDVEAYIKVLDRLKVAVDFFHNNNPVSVELSRLQDLFDQGLDTLQRDFMNMMKNSSRPVPLALLNDMVACDDVEDMPSLEHLPARTVSDLRATAEYLIAQSSGVSVGGNVQNKDILLVYSQLRSNQLGRSLNTFKEAHSSSQHLPSQIPKKASFAAALRKAHAPSPTKKGGRKTEVGGRVVSEFGGGVSDEGLDECGYIMAATTVFLRLIEGEVRLMRQVIPAPHQARVLRDLTAQPIEFYMKEVEILHQHVRKSLSHSDFPVVISVFRLIKHVQGLLPEYKVVLKDLEGSPYYRFEEIVRLFQRVNHKALEDYVTHIRGNPEKQSNLPKDGTVHELTSHTMWFVEQLLDYSRNVGDVLLGESSFGMISDADRRKDLGHYLTRVVDALALNMESKARSYEHPQLTSLFLLNNYHFIHKTFTRHDQMQGLLEEGFGDVEEHYIKNITTHLRNYQRWYSEMPFTKNPEKYLKYTPETLDEMLETFFDGGA